MSNFNIDIQPSGKAMIYFLITLFVAPIVVKWIWNTTLVDLFSFHQMGYWDAFKVILISNLIFPYTIIQRKFNIKIDED